MREELVRVRNETEHLLKTLDRLLDAPTTEDLEAARYLAYRIHKRLREVVEL